MTSYNSFNEEFQPHKNELDVCIWPTCFIDPTKKFPTDILLVGPQLPQTPLRFKSDIFLDDKQSKGISVLYICFGSTFWPPTIPQTEIMFDVLEELDMAVYCVVVSLRCQISTERF